MLGTHVLCVWKIANGHCDHNGIRFSKATSRLLYGIYQLFNAPHFAHAAMVQELFHVRIAKVGLNVNKSGRWNGG